METVANQMNPSLDQETKLQSAQDILKQAGISTNVPLSQLTEDQLNKIKTIQLQNTDPDTYKKLQDMGAISNGTIDKTKIAISSVTSQDLSPEEATLAEALKTYNLDPGKLP